MPIYSLGERHPELRGRAFVADTATVIGSVILEDESSVWFSAVVRGDSDLITIGRRTNVQDGAVLHADPGIPLMLGVGVTVGHQVMLHGCSVGDGALIGIGAVVLNHAVIGRNCLVGAGTLIPERKSFPDGVMILGQPGKVIRELEPEEIEGLRRAADVYVDRIARYREHLRPFAPGR
jgi:carbonic anhydrase/acetyltransferase-like protein (isoleucine patch superfamily)